MFAPYRIIKNAPLPLRRIDSGDTLNLSKDGGALALATNLPVETPGGSLVYYNELTAAEMGADHIAYLGTQGDSRSDGFLITEPAFDSGVAQAGSSSTITLRSAYGGTAALGCLIEIVRGTGSGQQPRVITSYDGGTKIAGVRPNWSTTPDNTSVYIITPLQKSNPMQLDGFFDACQYLAQFWPKAFKPNYIFSTGCTTTVFNTNFTGFGINPARAALMCLDGPNIGWIKPIVAYDSSTGQITVAPGFSIAPTNGETFAVFGLVG